MYAQEGLILEVAEQVWAALERRGVSKQELAQRLGTGKSHVTQVLNGGRNMTLRTLSDIAEALNQRVHVQLRDVESEAQWTTANVTLDWNPRSVLQMPCAVASNDYWPSRLTA
jgi:transcriptional regulator with XRE-family HTH domain